MTASFGMLGVDLTAPDHTTLSRRGQHLALALRRAHPGTSLHLIVDSTGLSIVGEGEWAAATHGGRGRRGWRKLHLGVDGSRVIVACGLTEPTADDAITGISLVDEVEGHLTRVTADPAYDTLAFYGAAGARGAKGVVPPTKTTSLSRRGARSGARDRTIRRVKALGRRRWKKASTEAAIEAAIEHAVERVTTYFDPPAGPSPTAREARIRYSRRTGRVSMIARWTGSWAERRAGRLKRSGESITLVLCKAAVTSSKAVAILGRASLPRARESHISGRFAARLKTRLRRSTCRAVTSVP